jgi:hypothetical protein
MSTKTAENILAAALILLLGMSLITIYSYRQDHVDLVCQEGC